MKHATLWLRRLAVLFLSALPGLVGAQSWQWAVHAPHRRARLHPHHGLGPGRRGGLVVAGTFTGTVAFGATTLTSTGPDDLYVARLDGTGAWTQAVRGGGPGAVPGALAVDGAGTVVLAGQFAGPATTFGAFALANAGTGTSRDVFVVRLNAAGAWTQAVRGGGAASDDVRGLALDAAGNAVVAGVFRDAATAFGSFALPNAGEADVYVARLSAAGTWTQAVRAGGMGNDQPYDIALEGPGNAVVAGAFQGATSTFGPVTLTNATAPVPPSNDALADVFVARLSAGGVRTQALRAGGPAADVAFGVAADAAGGSVLVAGSFKGPSAFGAITLASASAAASAAFVARVGGLPLGTGRAAPAARLALAPNPARTATILSVPAGNGAGEALVLDALGRVVRRQPVPARAASVALSVAGLPPGLYLVRCGNATGRLVVE